MMTLRILSASAAPQFGEMIHAGIMRVVSKNFDVSPDLNCVPLTLGNRLVRSALSIWYSGEIPRLLPWSE
jgi:hypothetical protein